MVTKELLDILACPSCKRPVAPKDAQPGENADSWLVCSGCGLRYPVRNDIPIMLIDEAVPAPGGERPQ